MRRRPEASPEARRRGSYSLFGEIIDWMLAPLLLLWPISIILTYDVATALANQPYDKVLADRARALSRQVRVTKSGRVVVDMPTSAVRLLRADAEDTIYFQVLSPKGELLAGDRQLTRPAAGVPLAPRVIHFRDAEIQGEPVRVAYLPVIVDQLAPQHHALVQVAETRHKRNGLSSGIVSGVLLPQFAIIPLAVVLVWFGLSRGIAPLNRLQSAIRKRRPGDLSPMPPEGVPEEIQPLVDAFNHMMLRLADNQQAQQHFIAEAAHQLRTPIAGLKMQVELAAAEIQRLEGAAELKRSLALVQAGSERAARLIHQLLALARAEASSENILAFARLDLAALVREVLAEHLPLAVSHGIDLGAEDAGPVWVNGAAVLLFELVSNLVDNAVKYTPAGGSVTVSTGIEPGDPARVRLAVRDDGPGIPPEERDRVFERFYRVLGTGAQGSGLGLAIVAEIAELHGAEVQLLPGEGGKGLTVAVLIPAVPA